MDMVTALRAIAAAFLAGALGCNGVPLATIDGGQDGGDGLAPLGDGGPGDAGACPKGSVTFVLNAAAGSTTGYCLGAPGNCTAEWLSLRAVDGGTLSMVQGCIAQCGSCMAVACPNICATPRPLGANGATLTWDGTNYPHGTCGSAQMPCFDTACAPAGSYVATMCGYATSGDASLLPGCTSGTTTPTCTDVPFEWPPPTGSATVNGTIGGDGG